MRDKRPGAGMPAAAKGTATRASLPLHAAVHICAHKNDIETVARAALYYRRADKRGAPMALLSRYDVIARGCRRPPANSAI